MTLSDPYSLTEEAYLFLKPIFIDHYFNNIKCDSDGWSIMDRTRLLLDSDTFIICQYIRQKDGKDKVAVFRLSKQKTDQWIKERST